MKPLRITLAAWMLSILFLGSSAPGQKSEVRGRITTGPTVSLITVAIDHFKFGAGMIAAADTEYVDNLRRILVDDLEFTLYFNIVKPDSAFLADFAGGKMTLDDWIYVGAQMLISCRLEKREGLYNLSVEVVDVFRNKLVYNNVFLGPPGEHRVVAHQVAEDLLFNLTGERGVFRSKIAYSSDVGGNRDIYNCAFDGANPGRITKSPGVDQMPAWNDTGDRLYFTTDRRNNQDLYVYEFSKGEEHPVSTREGLNYAAAVSPDGKSIAVSLTLSGNAEIYLLDDSGRIIRRLTYSWGIDTSPSWSPNSREIAFISDRSGNPQLYVIDVDGVNTRRLTYFGDYIGEPAWSPRGDLVAYSSREANQFQIYTVDITGQNAYKLTELGSNESPSWSPDGLHLAYSSNVDGKYGLWQMNFDGSGKRKLNLDGDCKSPDWSVNLR